MKERVALKQLSMHVIEATIHLTYQESSREEQLLEQLGVLSQS